jgi:hypothetical protein
MEENWVTKCYLVHATCVDSALSERSIAGQNHQSQTGQIIFNVRYRDEVQKSVMVSGTISDNAERCSISFRREMALGKKHKVWLHLTAFCHIARIGWFAKI